jgi:hypothetical protein
MNAKSQIAGVSGDRIGEMMVYAKLLRMRQPCFYRVTMNDSALTNAHWALERTHPNAVVRRIRGRKCRGDNQRRSV